MDTGLSPWMILGLILLIAFIAGFVLDLISVVLIIIPVAMPIVRMLGFDEIWFCVAFLVVLQTSYLTPPLAPAIFLLESNHATRSDAQTHVQRCGAFLLLPNWWCWHWS